MNPAQSILSLTAIGIPAKSPTASPRAIWESILSAKSNASSACKLIKVGETLEPNISFFAKSRALTT